MRVMECMGFSDRWLKLIQNSAEKYGFSVLINGESTGYFSSSRGLRQGYPLSPFLFLVTAKYLSRSINKLLHENQYMYYATRRKVRVTHLACVDDMMVFTSTKIVGLQRLMDTLSKYEHLSRQLVNSSKSSFIVSKSIPSLMVQRIKNITGYCMKRLPVKYLGASLYVGNKKSSLFYPLIQAMESYISGWEKFVLSHGGRLQLIKNVLLSIPVYLLRVIKPTKSVLIRIEQMPYHFFLGLMLKKEENALDKVGTYVSADRGMWFGTGEVGGYGCSIFTKVVVAPSR
ncbi:hypothetical protein Sango_2788000 [Sesamum angolense]|uniref:Reverse transcriptase domain-containing protein n=1 Tax=Sesamum angolense TaxID=2727404 RepID=A0AAE1T6U5_9LAMI|nr:hypothetical protein Sango_2788000 [Sesamum angolense]